METEIVSCPWCGGANRVKREKISDGAVPVCGSCHKALEVDVAPVNISDQSFKSDVLEFKRPVLVDLWATWCPPCRMIAPTLEEMASDYMGRLRIAKLDVDDNPLTQAQLQVSGIPTLVMFKNGQEVDRMVGAAPPDQLRAWAEQFIEPAAD